MEIENESSGEPEILVVESQEIDEGSNSDDVIEVKETKCIECSVRHSRTSIAGTAAPASGGMSTAARSATEHAITHTSAAGTAATSGAMATMSAKKLGKRPARLAVAGAAEDDVRIVSSDVGPLQGQPSRSKRRRRDGDADVACITEEHISSAKPTPVIAVLSVFPDAVPAHVKALLAAEAARRERGGSSYTTPEGDIEFVVQQMLALGFPTTASDELVWSGSAALDEDILAADAVAAVHALSRRTGEFECGCCYVEHPYAEVTPCPSGHLFCKTCVGQVVKRAAFDIGSTKIKCISTDECNQHFPIAMLRRVLPHDLYEQLINRQQDEALKAMQNLVMCPKPDCGFGVVIDHPEEIRVFKCSKCRAETCVKCHKDWKDHMGKRCDEVEDGTNTAARRSVEEAMTKAMLRCCAKCGLAFEKEPNTCNKMTCRCKAITCYICRALIKMKGKDAYKHFCQHPRNPGQKCTKCNKCELWTTPTNDSQMVAEARQRAVDAVGHQLASGITIAM